MASSSEGRRGEKPPPPPPAAVTLGEGKSGKGEGKSGKKKKVVRMSPEQMASYLSFKKSEPIPLFEGPPRLIDAMSKEFLARLPQDVVDKLAAVDLDRQNRYIAEANEMDDDLAREAEDVRRQYLEKGYVEYEVDEDEYAPVAPPAPGRRRHRPGVSRKSGTTTKRIN